MVLVWDKGKKTFSVVHGFWGIHYSYEPNQHVRSGSEKTQPLEFPMSDTTAPAAATEAPVAKTSTTVKVLKTVAIVGAAGLVGYAAYRFFKKTPPAETVTQTAEAVSNLWK